MRPEWEVREAIRHIAEIQGIVYDPKHPDRYNALNDSYWAFQRMLDKPAGKDGKQSVIETADLSRV